VPRRDPSSQTPALGGRVSLRRMLADGRRGDLIGFVLVADADRLVVRDRRGVVHELSWPDVLALRGVGVARGRDPLRTPCAELDRLAVAAGVSGRVFVARLSDLLDGREPLAPPDWAAPPPCPATLEGEWVTAGPSPHLLALAWWASHHDARSIQVRTGDAGAIAELAQLGLRERTDEAAPGQN